MALGISPQSYFNSRPSARGDHLSFGTFSTQDISIHAPPRGATMLIAETKAQARISIHAPPRGATEEKNHDNAGKDDFNSRPSARGDGDVHGEAGRVVQFQFTPLREGRHGEADGHFRRFLFQFTPLREGRRLNACLASRRTYFNSRPSARGDFPGVRESGRRENFNSRPSARGDTPGTSALHRRLISIHAPPRGATSEVRT